MITYLLQRGKFQEKCLGTITKSVRLSYMGSSEFEWGALPKSLQRVMIFQPIYKMYELPEFKDKLGNSLFVFCKEKESEIEQIKEVIAELKRNSLRMKEYSDFDTYFKLTKEQIKKKEYNTDFWWDIENDFFMFFGNKNKEIFQQAFIESMKVVFDNFDKEKGISFECKKKGNFYASLILTDDKITYEENFIVLKAYHKTEKFDLKELTMRNSD